MLRAGVLATITALTGAVMIPSTTAPSTGETVAAPAADAEGPIMQMFGWPWDSLAEQCRSSLGPDGYTAIQVSPPTEHVRLAEQGHPWYEDYQPVSYELRSSRGGADNFENMVTACNGSGVKVYVDAVLNHMSGSGSQGSGPGSAGTEYSKYDYPGTYVDSDFHDCRENISDYTDQWEVRNCELVGPADLRTGSNKVRETQTAYLNRLIDMGVSGFRPDGSEHMPPQDIAALVDGLHKTTSGAEPYIYQEVIADSTTRGTEYTGNGDVTTFTYTDRVATAFATGAVADLRNLPEETRLGSEQAVVFVANHDTERDSPPLNHADGAAYDLANAFTLAVAYGTPGILSGFDFGGDTAAGPPSDGAGFTRPANCADGGAWVCTHRHVPVVGMVGFNEAVRGTGLTEWWDNGSNLIAFGRGDAGYVVFNSGGAGGQASGETTRRFHSCLPAGTYCNVLTGRFHNGECAGETVEVGSDGTFTATLGPNSGVALHRGAELTG